MTDAPRSSAIPRPIIEVINLTRVIATPTHKVEILRGINLTIPQGEFAAIMGPSGSGKSTLLGLLAGMTLPRNYGPDYIHSFEQVYVEIARQFDLTRIPFLLDGVAGHPDLIQADDIHPTAQGCEIVSGTVMQYLKMLLKK